MPNQLLAALSKAEYSRLPAKSRACLLPLKQIIYAPNQVIEYVYFPTDGIISLVNVTQNGGIVEAATVGNEGMVGIPVLLGGDQMVGQAIVQVAGDAVRMKADIFKREVTPGSTLHRPAAALHTSVDDLNLAIGRLQLPALGRTALLPLVANLPRPSEVRLF
jgi:hypothetical protein